MADDPSDQPAGELDPDELDVDDDLAADVDELIEDRSVPAAADDVAAGVAAESDETVVPTQYFCRSCEYFSEPPEVHCTHEGTTIVEFVDLEHAKVRDCPIVERRRSLVDQAVATFTSNNPQQ